MMIVESDGYGFLVQIAGMVLALMAGFGGIVPVVDLIKKRLAISARWSQLLTVGVVVLFTILTLLVEGVLSPDAISSSRAFVVFMTILTASQAEYQRVVRAQANDVASLRQIE